MSILILSVSVIKSDPTGKTGIAWFTTVPLNSLSDQVHILYQCFCFLQLFIFICGFSAKVVLVRFLLIRSHGESHRYDTFRVRKKIVSFTFFIRVRFQRCKSGIDIFAWKVTYNYAYIPFKNHILRTPILPQKSFLGNSRIHYSKQRNCARQKSHRK